jgi:hypothetical protein
MLHRIITNFFKINSFVISLFINTNNDGNPLQRLQIQMKNQRKMHKKMLIMFKIRRECTFMRLKYIKLCRIMFYNTKTSINVFYNNVRFYLFLRRYNKKP